MFKKKNVEKPDTTGAVRVGQVEFGGGHGDENDEPLEHYNPI